MTNVFLDEWNFLAYETKGLWSKKDNDH